MLAAAILAAGESRRMGRPKPLILYRGRTFLEHLIEVTRHPRVGITRVVLGAGAEEIRQQLRASSIESAAAIAKDAAAIVVNERWPLGQLSSIQCAVRSLPGGVTEGMILCPVDHALISADLVAQLIAAFDASGKLIALPTFRGRRGHPLIFRASLYEELLAASADVGARQVVWAHAESVLEAPTQEEGVILNLNDPAALDRALKDR
jgi:molybdenum cofactor cytidylyltransferase